MKKLALAFVLLVATAGFAGQAAAGIQTEVKYSLVAAAFLGPIPVAPAPAIGMATITYTSVADSTNVLHGPAGISTLSLLGSISFTFGGNATFTGSLSLMFGGQQAGSLMSTGLLTLPLAGTAGGTIHCFGVGICTGLGLPSSIPDPITLPFNTLFSAIAATIGSNLLPTFTATGVGFGTFGGLLVNANIQFTELSRTNVPEPTSAALVGLGMAGMAGISWVGRRRRG